MVWPMALRPIETCLALEIAVAAVVKQNSQQNDTVRLPNIAEEILLDPGQG